MLLVGDEGRAQGRRQDALAPSIKSSLSLEGSLFELDESLRDKSGATRRFEIYYQR